MREEEMSLRTSNDFLTSAQTHTAQLLRASSSQSFVFASLDYSLLEDVLYYYNVCLSVLVVIATKEQDH
jgi:hypothetical protein